MGTEISKPAQSDLSGIKSLVLTGDLSKLDDIAKMKYYAAVCDSIGVNPLTQPFSYLKLNGKEVLYANRSCTEQLRKLNGVSVTALEGKQVSDLYIVTCGVKDSAGRTDVSTGAVNMKGLAGEALANAIMKAETKAKRRATLSICGLGYLDESEVESVRHDPHPTPEEEQRIKNEVRKDIASNINESQCIALKAACRDVGAVQSKILIDYGANSWGKIPAKEFDTLMKRIKAKDPAFMPTPKEPLADQTTVDMIIYTIEQAHLTPDEVDAAMVAIGMDPGQRINQITLALAEKLQTELDRVADTKAITA